MTLRMLAILTWILLAVSACVVEPYGDSGRGDYYRGGHDRDREHGDYGRGVWRG